LEKKEGRNKQRCAGGVVYERAQNERIKEKRGEWKWNEQNWKEGN